MTRRAMVDVEDKERLGKTPERAGYSTGHARTRRTDIPRTCLSSATVLMMHQYRCPVNVLSRFALLDVVVCVDALQWPRIGDGPNVIQSTPYAALHRPPSVHSTDGSHCPEKIRVLIYLLYAPHRLVPHLLRPCSCLAPGLTTYLCALALARTTARHASCPVHAGMLDFEGRI